MPRLYNYNNINNIINYSYNDSDNNNTNYYNRFDNHQWVPTTYCMKSTNDS